MAVMMADVTINPRKAAPDSVAGQLVERACRNWGQPSRPGQSTPAVDETSVGDRAGSRDG